MTKHDEIRQILNDSGFKFADGRTALEMTDTEVEEFLVRFISIVAEFGRKVQVAMHTTLVSFNQAVEPIRVDMARLLSDVDRRY